MTLLTKTHPRKTHPMNPWIIKQILVTASILAGIAYKGMKLYSEYQKARYYNSLKEKEDLYNYHRETEERENSDH